MTYLSRSAKSAILKCIFWTPMKAVIKPPGAFSLVETLVIVAVIGVVATVGVPLVTGLPDAARRDKLEQDVATVNNAIDLYLAAGGAPEGLTADNVIEALKSRIYGGMPAEMVGPQGPFLEPTVITNSTDFAWSALFTTQPRPRFFVAQSTNGVIFGKGPARAVGGVAERPDEARPSWLWTYGQATSPPEIQAYNPLVVDAGAANTTPSTAGTTLSPPIISPSSQSLQLWDFPLSVSISNPNPQGSSRVYFRAGSGSFSLHDGSPIAVDPNASIEAVCVSLDPSRYYNSGISRATYSVTPLELALTISAPPSVTYGQAGGLMEGIAQLSPVEALISLQDGGNLINGAPDNLLLSETGNDKYIPPAYLKIANFNVRYTIDGSDPSSSPTAQSGPAFSGFFSPVRVGLGLSAWGTNTNTSISIRAVAISSSPELFTSSAVQQATSEIQTTPLPLSILPANPVGLPFQVRIQESSPVPSGLRKFYTSDGRSPLTSGTGGSAQPYAQLYGGLISGGNLPSSSYTLTAQATGPSGFEKWFSSPVATRTYSPLTVLNTNLVGANISGGDINGSFRGSIFVSAPANLGIFNAGGTITRGNLYLPGLPEIEVTGQGNRGTTVVGQGQSYTGTPPVSRTVIAGKEFSADGRLAEPQLDTRQIVDQAGTSTNVYTVKITTSTFIEGKIYRNVDLPTNTFAVPAIGVTNVVTGTFRGDSGATNLLVPGIYSNNIALTRTNSVLRLGTGNTNQVAQYVFSGGDWSKGRVEIVGPVQIFYTTGFTNSGVIFGSTNTVDLLSVFVTSGNADVEFKSGGEFYGSLWVTNATSGRNDVTVGNGSSLFGSVTAEYLSIAPGGIVNVE